MSGFKRSFLFLALAVAALAQTESQIESDEVKRVGSHINCQCGSCTENVNCMMSAGQCHFCKPTRTQIFKDQQAGMNDSQIFTSFIQQYGGTIFRRGPNSWFWLIPYISLGAGALIVALVLVRVRKHARRPAAAGPQVPDDPSFARYRDAIEKDTARLE